MRAKIELSEDDGASVIDSFWYQGGSSGRSISYEIRRRFNVSPSALFRVVQQKGARVCVWCKVEPPNTASTGQERDSAHEPALSKSDNVPAQGA